MKYQPATNAREALNKAQERDTQIYLRKSDGLC